MGRMGRPASPGRLEKTEVEKESWLRVRRPTDHQSTIFDVHRHRIEYTDQARLVLPQAKFQRPSNVAFLLLMSRHYLEKKRINLLRVSAAWPVQ